MIDYEKSSSFVIDNLKSFVAKFPKVKVRYEIDRVANVHSIEITPRTFLFTDDDILDWKINLFKDFVNLFPFESIGFCSDDALVGIRNVDFEIEGSEFGKLNLSCFSN